MADRPKILFLVTEDWYFCSHRLGLARAARDAGAEVAVATRVRDHGRVITDQGFRLLPLTLRRGGRNPLAELPALAEIVRIYRRERPDLVHHVAMKPVLYGSLAAALARVPVVVNALTGLGALFIGGSATARLLGPVVRAALQPLLDRANSHLILQNDDDRALLERHGLIRHERVHLIRGSGVDVGRFRPAPEPDGPPVAALVARMLWDKGVGEFVAAARLLKRRGVAARLVLAGPPDPENPAAIPEAVLRAWQAEGAVEWRGAVADIAGLWAEASIAVLPSYREGLPKALLEAAACGRPLVAADVPGCREIVRPGATGVLVPPRDAGALADAIELLADDAALRARLGRQARALAEAEFAEEIVVRRTLDLYRALLPGRLQADAPSLPP
ncbi:MAG: glycosyltransferase family 4 protein, partial [Dongiaceae bacterium]